MRRLVLLAILVLRFPLSALDAAQAAVFSDTVTHQVSTQDSASAIDFRNLSVTLKTVNVEDSTGIVLWNLGQTNGTKLGGATSKIGFFNATPVTRRSSTSDLRQLLIDYGLLAPGGASPLNLNGGALTAGNATFSGTVSLGSNLAVPGNLSVTGTTGLTGAFTGTTATFSGPVSVTRAFTGTTATFSGTVGVTGAFTGTTASFSGPLTLKKTGDATASVTFDTSPLTTGTTSSTVKIPQGTTLTVPARASQSGVFLTGILSTGQWLSQAVSFSDVTYTPTTLAGYGITDAQPLDSDLTALAALSTTSFGRAFNTVTDAATARTYIGLAIGTNVQAYSSNLDGWALKVPFQGNLQIASAKQMSFPNTLTISGIDGSTLNIGAGGTLGPNAFSSVAAVPQSRTINTYPLTTDVVLTASDVGVRIGQNVQAYSANLDAWALKTPYTGTVNVPLNKTFTASNSITITGTDGASLNIGSGGPLGSNAFSSIAYVPQSTTINGYPLSNSIDLKPQDLGLEIGIDVQGYSSNLQGWSNHVPYSGNLNITLGKTASITGSITLTGSDGATLNFGNGGTLGSNAFSSISYVPQSTTVNGHALSGNVSVTPGDLGLVIGTNVQAWSSALDSLSGKIIPTGTTLVDTASSQTLINKALTSPVISTLVSAGGSALNLNSASAAAGSGSIAGPNANLTAAPATAGILSSGAAKGGDINLTAGNAARFNTGNALGGNVIVKPGRGIGSGTSALPGKFVVNSNTTAPLPNDRAYTLASEIWNAQFVLPDGVPGGIGIDSFGTGPYGAFSILDFRRANNTAASPQALQADDIIGVIGAFGYQTTQFSGGAAQIRWRAAENWTDSQSGSYLEFLATIGGSNNLNTALRLSGDRAVFGDPGSAATRPTIFYSGGINIGDVYTDPGVGYLQVTKGVKFTPIAAGSVVTPVSGGSILFCDSATSPCVMKAKDSSGTLHALY